VTSNANLYAVTAGSVSSQRVQRSSISGENLVRTDLSGAALATLLANPESPVDIHPIIIVSTMPDIHCTRNDGRAAAFGLVCSRL